MKLTKSLNLIFCLVLGVSLFACTAGTKKQSAQTQSTQVTPSEIVLSFAVLGDAEPKPEPKFPNLAAAVADVNRLAEEKHFDFIVGVGDIAHKGTRIQYDNATPVLQQLTLPFYPIMGNEEYGSTVERYLKYANLWNQGKIEIAQKSYVLEFDSVALIFASPDYSRQFNDEGIAWILEQVTRLESKPVMLIVHAAQAGVYSENKDKGVTHPRFADIVAKKNVAAVISGDLHMDMERVQHSKQIGHVHYLHIPALERTKIPDESRHTPLFRVVSVTADGEVLVDTYQVDVVEPLARHAYRFNLPVL